MLFKKLVEKLEDISLLSSRNQIIEKLSEIFKQLSPDQIKVSTYLLTGELYPSYKSSRFSLAEAQVKNFIISFFLEKKKSPFIQELFDSFFREKGDLSKAYELFFEKEKIEKPQDKGLKIESVYKLLEDLNLISGTGSLELKKEQFLKILNQLDPLSGKFIIKIILKKLRLGFSSMTMLDALSFMHSGDKSLKKELENAFNVSADLGLIAETLKLKNQAGVLKIKPQAGIPIRPSAAERLSSPEEIIKKLGSCVAQPKIDGLRLQVHKYFDGKEAKVKFFSRNMLDISYMFSQISKELLNFDLSNFIVEGEIVSFDEKTKRPLPFQETSKSRRKHEVESFEKNSSLKLFLFDVLLFEKDSTLNLAHFQRRKILEENFEKKSEKIIVIQEKKISIENGEKKAALELVSYFKEVVSLGHEGLMIKRADGVYRAGKRNFNWIKLKQIEKGGLGDTLDCVVLGYYFGMGKRADFKIGAILVGVYNEQKEEFESVCKVGTGLKDKDLFEIKKRLDENKLEEKPENFIVEKGLYPDVWAEPKLILEIEADEISLSPQHTASRDFQEKGLALRFPRLVGFRLDKSFKEATTSTELSNLYRKTKK